MTRKYVTTNDLQYKFARPLYKKGSVVLAEPLKENSDFYKQGYRFFCLSGLVCVPFLDTELSDTTSDQQMGYVNPYQ